LPKKCRTTFEEVKEVRRPVLPFGKKYKLDKKGF